MTKTLKKLSAIIGLSLLFSTVAALVLHYLLADLVDGIESVTYDWRYRMKYQGTEEGVEFPDYGIHIVDIDERSMGKMGSYWGWDRGYQAKMVDSLTSRFPASIAFDVLFYDREYEIRYGRLAKVLDDAISSDSVLASHSEIFHRRLADAVNYDAQFEAAIARSGRVTLGIALDDASNYRDFTSQIAHRMDMEWHNSLNPASALYIPDSLLRRIRHTKTIIDGVYPENAQAALQIGHVNIVDQTLVVRQVPLFYRFADFPPLYLPMSVRIAATLFGTPNDEIVFEPNKYFDIGKPFKIFKDADGRARFSYPDFTETQLKIILASDKWMPAPDTWRWKADVSSYLALYRDGEGRTCLETRGGRLPHGLTAAIKNLTGQDDKGGIDKMEIDAGIDIGGGFTLRRDSQAEWEIFSDDDQFWLTALDIKTLAALIPNDIELDEGVNRKLLTFDFWVRREKGILISTLPVLRGKTLEQLLEAGPKLLETITAGSRRDFGDPARIPLIRHNRHTVTYFGPKSKPFQYFSFYDIMENNVHFPMEGRIFIIGSSSPSLFDIKSTPHERIFPAVEIHASIMNSIFTGTYVRRLTDRQDLLILAAVGFIAALIAFLTKPLWGGILTGAGLLAYSAAAFQIFDTSLLWIEMVRPMITILLTFTCVMVYRYITEERDKRFLQSMFKHYLSPELIDMMYTQKQKPQLGGDEGILTAFFTDIEGFSTFSEKLGSPTRLVELLNEYLSAMTDILLSHYGTLDKYEGDAIIAFFGAPASLPNHAARACHTAIEMQQKLEKLREKWSAEKCDRRCADRESKCGDKCGQKDKWPEIVHGMRMRIGINTGNITTGNMGSAVRMNYTMMGDAVNLAARLESAAKQYGVYTMISEFTYNEIKEFEVRKLGRIKVVGKSEAVTVYELIGRKSEMPEEITDLLKIYNLGIEYYYKKEWAEALICFTKACEMEPNAKAFPNKPNPSKRFAEACRMLIDNPPGDDWDGVEELLSK
ncbi:MAG: CHASE2 domain-containing protein [Chitinispirillia bacterium]|nr:CHASE2 domain-containing protein [Chitinispirillia bacterium]